MATANEYLRDRTITVDTSMGRDFPTDNFHSERYSLDNWRIHSNKNHVNNFNQILKSAIKKNCILKYVVVLIREPLTIILQDKTIIDNTLYN